MKWGSSWPTRASGLSTRFCRGSRSGSGGRKGDDHYRPQAREWAYEEVKQKWPKRRTQVAELSRDFDFMLKVVSKPEVLEQFSLEQKDRLVWHIPWILQDTQRVEGYGRQRLTLTARVPEFFDFLFGESVEPSTGLEMVWDVAIVGINKSDRALLETVFESLVRQLAIPNQWCQASAIHGFNHLKEPRCRPILRQFANNCDDRELAAYARNAMTFQLM